MQTFLLPGQFGLLKKLGYIFVHKIIRLITLFVLNWWLFFRLSTLRCFGANSALWIIEKREEKKGNRKKKIALLDKINVWPCRRKFRHKN